MVVTTRTINNKDKSNPTEAIEASVADSKPFHFKYPIDKPKGRDVHEMVITVNETFFNSAIVSAFSGPRNSTSSAISKIFGEYKRNYRSTINPAQRQDRIKKSKGTITFNMPSAVMFTDANEFGDVSLTNEISEFIGNAVGVQPLARFIDGVGAISKFGGLPINPRVEILFGNRPQRRFMFEISFAPTSKKESNHLDKAIRHLRAAAAPEIMSNTFGFIWKSPSTFDIQFLHNGKENKMIPKIDEVVLEQVDFDTTVSGQWSTFTNGFPVASRLVLTFRERKPLDKAAVEAGY